MKALRPFLLRLVAVVLFFGSVQAQINFGGGSGDFPTPARTSGSCSGGKFCQSYVSCPYALHDGTPEGCDLGQGNPGVCCDPSVHAPEAAAAQGGLAAPSAGPGTFDNALITRQKEQVQLPQSVDTSSIDSAAPHVSEAVLLLRQQDSSVLASGNFIRPGGPGSQHQRFHQATPGARAASELALQSIELSRNLQTGFQLDTRQSGLGLQQVNVQNSALNNICPQRPGCQSSRGIEYRTADGSCNNQQDTILGKSNTQSQRILPAAYDDGIFSPRTRSRSGRPLASARAVSVAAFHADEERRVPDARTTLALVQWGQFLDHDITLGAIFFLDEQGNGAECCRNGQIITPSPHFSCFPISIAANDPFYNRFQQRCMNFVRTMPAPRLDCNLGYAEQVNQLTHWIDASMVYGSTAEAARSLRSNRDGLLRISTGSGRSAVLPRNNEPGQVFSAGDDRVNEAIGLTAMHTIWVRQHNQIAAELKRLNGGAPGWNDEKIYQETRRIVAALIQHITYNEFLPAVLGERYARNFGIRPLTSGYKTGYDPSINPQINNEFATAAFRYGHSKLPGTWNLFFGERNTPRPVQLSDVLNNPNIILEPRAVDALVRAFIKSPAEETDGTFTNEVRGRLFRESGQFFGMDLMALNVQRGRDHGLQPYNRYREVCGLGAARSWNDLASDINPEGIQRLQGIYETVDDVDLFVGGILERTVEGAEVGRTFTCIIGDQFLRLQRGDRFYYEWGGLRHSFTPAQLQEIRKMSMARVFCDNSEGVVSIQPLAFFQDSPNLNPIVTCNDLSAIPRMSLQAWANAPFKK